MTGNISVIGLRKDLQQGLIFSVLLSFSNKHHLLQQCNEITACKLMKVLLGAKKKVEKVNLS